MTSYLPKLVIALFLAAASLSSARAGDILMNGDFTDGKTHWHGDGDSPDTGGRLVITLKPDKWTVVYQNFSAESPQLKLKIKYTFSDDCTLAVPKSDDELIPPLTAKGLEEATGLANNIYNMTMYQGYSWMVAIVSGGYLDQQYPVRIKSEEGNPRTFTAALSQWNGKFINDNLCLAFPPGKGTVTITDVELLPPKSSQ